MHMIISLSIQTKGQVMLGYGGLPDVWNLTRFLARKMLMAAIQITEHVKCFQMSNVFNSNIRALRRKS